MTRPMPGPPEPVPHEFDTLPHKLTDDPWPYCSGCAAENRIHLADPKRLTDAECAAEFWRADGECIALDNALIVGWSNRETVTNADTRAETWKRFMDTTHALEES